MPCGCALLAYVGLALLDGMPRTLQIEIEAWQNRSWGFHSIERQQTNCKIAVSSDGSRRNQCDSQSFRYFLIPQSAQRYTTIYIRRSNEAYLIEEKHGAVSGGECSCSWIPQRQHQSDPGCVQAAQDVRAEFTTLKRVGAGHTAGQRVIRYFERSNEGASFALALAPDAGCEVMEATVTHPGTLGIPAARWRYRVTSYTGGEPDANRFKAPSGYSRRTTRR